MGIINLINDLLWTYILVALLLGCAVWFTLRTRFVQFRMIKEWYVCWATRAGKAMPRKSISHRSRHLPSPLPAV